MGAAITPFLAGASPTEVGDPPLEAVIEMERSSFEAGPDGTIGAAAAAAATPPKETERFTGAGGVGSDAVEGFRGSS
jgi:hypothetical protein